MYKVTRQVTKFGIFAKCFGYLWVFTLVTLPVQPARTRASDVTNRVRLLVERVLIHILLSWASLQRPLYSLLGFPCKRLMMIWNPTQAQVLHLEKM